MAGELTAELAVEVARSEARVAAAKCSKASFRLVHGLSKIRQLLAATKREASMYWMWRWKLHAILQARVEATATRLMAQGQLAVKRIGAESWHLMLRALHSSSKAAAALWALAVWFAATKQTCRVRRQAVLGETALSAALSATQQTQAHKWVLAMGRRWQMQGG